MKIGFVVEGATDEAFIHGLGKQLCPGAVLYPILGRGKQSTDREVINAIKQGSSLGYDLVVVLSDGNGRPWREVLKTKESKLTKVLEQTELQLLIGVPDRNIECWIWSDLSYISMKTGRSANVFKMSDPKQQFESAMEINNFNRQKEKVQDLVEMAPIGVWRRSSPSFADFCQRAVELSKNFGCSVQLD